MRKYLIASAIAAVLTATAPQAAMAETMPVAAPADAAMIARKEVLVRRYFAVIHIYKIIDSTMKSLVPAMIEQMRKSNPALTAEDGKVVSDAAIETMAEIGPEYMSQMVGIYADAFTEDELTQLVAFYESPVGRSITAKIPGLAPKTSQIMVALMPKIQASITTKMCAKIACPADKPSPTKSKN